MAGVGTNISAVDYNNIRSKILNILGNGVGQSGYGQPLQSTDVAPGNNVTEAQWTALRYDVLTAKYHQDGEAPALISVNQGDVIRYGAGHPVTNYITIADQAVIEKFEIAPSNTELTPSVASQSTSATWSAEAQCTLTTTWLNANDARHFFNSGGKVRVNTSFVANPSASNPIQSNAWNALLTGVGIVDIGGNIPLTSNFYTLTTSYTTLFLRSSSAPYAANYFKIEALCNCSDATNVNGTANVVTFRFTWADEYVDPGAPPPGDGPIDGTLRIDVDELKARSPLYPADSSYFNIESPSYSISSITTS